jgi:hypothetical protein
MLYAPVSRRVLGCLIWITLAAVGVLLAIVGRDFSTAMPVLGLIGSALCVFAAVRIFRSSILLDSNGVTVRAVFWTVNYTWNEVVRFEVVRIRSGFDAVESPFLHVSDGSTEELIALPLMRSVALPFEGRAADWRHVLTKMEQFRACAQSPPSP